MLRALRQRLNSNATAVGSLAPYSCETGLLLTCLNDVPQDRADITWCRVEAQTEEHAAECVFERVLTRLPMQKNNQIAELLPHR